MTLPWAPPPSPDSPLTRLDSRWRLLALVIAALATALLRTLPTSATALGAALLLALVARLPLRWLLTRLGGMALFLLLFAGPLPLLLSGPGWDMGPMHVSLRGLEAAALLCCKALAIVIVCLVGVTAAPIYTSLAAARALGVPRLLVQLALLSYRYVFLLSDELRRLRVALRVRGFRNRTSRHAWRTFGHVAGTLLVRGHDRAERVGQAMRCRGFAGQLRTLDRFQSRPADALAFALVAGSALALVAWDWFLARGA